MSNYTIESKRIVPAVSVGTTLTGKTVYTPLNHAGQNAVFVKLQDGRAAWGFGNDWSAAETAAVIAANQI